MEFLFSHSVTYSGDNDDKKNHVNLHILQPFTICLGQESKQNKPGKRNGHFFWGQHLNLDTWLGRKIYNIHSRQREKLIAQKKGGKTLLFNKFSTRAYFKNSLKARVN